MTPEQFTYWLQGFNEIREKEAVGLTEKEWDIIKDHLRTVFHKVTPERGAPIYQPTQPYTFPSPHQPPQDPFGQFYKVVC